MRALIDNLKLRSAKLAEVARDRGLGALGKVRDGSLDWHKTLEARRAELINGHEPAWYSLGGLQVRLLDRVDRTLELFSERVREEIARLQQLELGSGTKAAKAEAKSKATGKKTAAKPKAKKPAARAKKATADKSSRRFVMPIAGYDDMNAKEVLSELSRLSVAQCEVVRAHEVGNKNRKTVLKAIDSQIAAG